MKSSNKKLERLVDNGLYTLYGETPDRKILHRIAFELAIIRASDIPTHFMAFHDLALFLKSRNIPYVPISTSASAFVFYLLGMTFANPLPPHYHCPSCHSFLWDNSCKNGFDLPPRRCPCGQGYVRDGHDLAEESYWGVSLFEKEQESPCGFCIRIPKSVSQIVFDYVGHHPAQDVFTPVEHHEDSGNHHFGELLLRTGDDLPDESKSFCEHMPSEEIKQSLQKHLEIPGIECLPNTFYELIRAVGVSHSYTEWHGGDRETILSIDTAALDEYFAHREDFYEWMGDKLTRREIWEVSERIRKGRGMLPQIEEMIEAKWLVDYINGIYYLPSKSQSVEWLIAKAKLT